MTLTRAIKELKEAERQIERLRVINKHNRDYIEYLQGLLTMSNVKRSNIFAQGKIPK